ncbi:MAG TPA: cytochrome P450 [Nitrospira sp.]|nr:cytochrome P450 [Nitrospira sp.]
MSKVENLKAPAPGTFFSRWTPRRATLAAWLTGPTFSRPLNALLRRLAPILMFGQRVIVSRHADVVDALARDTEFTISEINAERTNRDNGPFVLSMDRSQQHDREKKLLNSVMNREDAHRIRAIVISHVQKCLDRVRTRDWIDVVNDLTRRVPLGVVSEYFGVPGPDDTVMLRWMRTLFHDLFLNLTNDQKVAQKAVASFEEMRPYLLGWIARRKAEIAANPGQTNDDVLTRMIHCQRQPGMEWLDDDCVRRNISGLIVGAVDTTSTAATKVIDQLLRRPNELAEARQAARAGDEATLGRYVWEALRFNPHNPIIIRHGQPGAVLGQGTSGRHKLSGGQMVYLGTFSAMFDPIVFPDPNCFRTDRDPTRYLHFSAGLHACQGRYVSGIQIPLIVAGMLRLADAHRAPGWDGRIAYDGPFPDRMILKFSV